MLTILSLNTGLLRLAGGLFEPTPYTRERAAALPAALIRTGADVLVLQEIYEQSHRQQLVVALAKTYPHAAHIQVQRRFGLDSSLMVLSREPLAAELECFESAPIDERWLDNKGILAIRMQPPAGPRLEILNIHMTAGGAFHHPEHASIDRLRAQQIEQLLRRARAVRGAIPLIVGDLNAGPGVSDNNYRLLERAQYVDIHRFMNGVNDEVTWDPRNPLNSNSPHRTSPAQRIDHVFVRRSDLDSKAIVPRRSEIVLHEPIVNVSGDKRVTISDHYGLRVELDLG